ncbi:type II 3-dehydroquinate dehydratase [Actinorugispora endophytica]|uniref:3-dehydroquinate dehydratase n=1 Tax=Actinorugispora endophytica TaxID=1605990 RepID=A0A4R6V6E1_9ACTN|nr:type II 3-dehydroquinate dehydratase [Actinorugispora endophytica]TDQ54458.1 3-dehydroquinate dehydratase [Actinorugispora endophytica]
MDAPRAARPTVLLLNGPNLNLLGERDPAQYGSTTLADVEKRVSALGAELGVDVVCAQSNHEGALVDHVHSARAMDGIVFNPGAYAHYSIALRDAVDAVAAPCVEVHVSNVYAREPFRHTSVTAPVMRGSISGCGVHGYELALRHVVSLISGESR